MGHTYIFTSPQPHFWADHEKFMSTQFFYMPLFRVPEELRRCRDVITRFKGIGDDIWQPWAEVAGGIPRTVLYGPYVNQKQEDWEAEAKTIAGINSARLKVWLQ